ncbi:c-type cytochrome [Sulfitobacter sp. LCG007]
MKPAVFMLGLLCPIAGLAQDNSFRLSAPQGIAETGFLDFLLPRFSLKHGIRVDAVASDAPADLRLGREGVPVFSGLGVVWGLDGIDTDSERAFADWLQSEIGQRTVASFPGAGESVFGSPPTSAEATPAVVHEGDAVAGQELSLTHCGRCHVVNERNRMNGLGSTPSFAMLRTLDEWEGRFLAFYALNPHPSFTQIEGVTPPFDAARPPPISPMRISLDEIDAILAYVATIAPADLGAPITSQ